MQEEYFPHNSEIRDELNQIILRSFRYITAGAVVYFFLRSLSVINGPHPSILAGSMLVCIIMAILLFLLFRNVFSTVWITPISLMISGSIVGNSYFTYLVSNDPFQLILCMFAMLIIPLTTLRTKVYLVIVMTANLTVIYTFYQIPEINTLQFLFSCLSELIVSNIMFFSFRNIVRKQVVLKLMNDHKAQALLKANKSKDVFLANITHELRTPLTGVTGIIDLLSKTKLDEEQKNLVFIAQRSAKILISLINDILDLSKLQDGKLALKNVDGCPNNITRDVYNIMRPLASEKGYDLNLSAPDGKYYMKFDELRVGQILYNLIGNAIKFTDEGSVDIEFSIQPDGDGKYKARWEIKDTGIGISPEQQEKLFHRFEQLNNQKYNIAEHSGTGLGLAISKNITRLMQGDIGYRNRTATKGSCFWFQASFQKAQIVAPITLESLNNLSAFRDRKLSFLIAEDNHINQMIIKKYIQTDNWSVTTVENGLLAVEAVKQHNQHFDIILMDIMMPEMNGRDAMAAITAINPDIPIIAITANASPEDFAIYKSDGFKDSIAKPIEATALFATIDTVLSDSI